MGGRALLVVLTGFVAVSGIMFINMAHSGSEMSSNVDAYYLRQLSVNVAQGGVRLGVRQLANNPSWRAGFTNMALMGGRVTVWAVDTTFNGQDVVGIRAIGTAGVNTNQQISTTSFAFVRASVPFQPRAVIVANNDIAVSGGFTLSGRDRTPAGAIIPNKGVYGVWTRGTFTQQGGSVVGGTDPITSTDYPPANPGNPAIIKQGQVWPGPGNYPGTPDSVFGGASKGFPEGTLKSIAQSGVNGSQYVTNPSALTWPLKGVTYVELPNNGVWSKPDLNGSGILIVHNAGTNARLDNINSGTFNGLILVDDLSKMKCDVMGAIICLASTPSQGKFLGQADGSLLYSSEVINQATSLLPQFAPGNGSESNVLAWREF